MRDKAKNILVWYLTITFTAASALSFGFWTKSAIHYVPGLAALGLYLFKLNKPVFKGGDLGLSLRGGKYWIIAPLAVTALYFLSIGISLVLHPDLLKSNDVILLSLEDSGFYIGHVGWSILSIAMINALLGSLAAIPVYLGQELGWRAFMQPLLFKIFNTVPAFFSGGIFWGLWVFFFSGQEFISAPGPFIESLLTVLFCIPLGVILQYFYFRSRSIFVAALAHAAIIKAMDTASLVLIDAENIATLYGPMGIPGIVVFWAVALILLIKIKWQLKNTYHENTK